jgi:hypothetical protein
VATLNAGIVIRDPLRHLEPLSHSATCYPLGYPLAVHTNCADVLEAARDSFGGYARSCDTPPIQMRVLVSDDAGGEFPDRPVFRGSGEVMSVVADRNNHAVCDFGGNAISIHVERRVVNDRPWFRMRFLESTTLSTLTCRYLMAVHAACVARDGRGVLLHAASGTGKSCLAYECARRGWTYVSDDASFLRRDSDSRIVIGRPGALKFVETAVALFPELAGKPTLVDPRGKPVILMNPGEDPTIRTAMSTPVEALVFLRRERGAAGVHALDAEDAWERLVSEIAMLTPASFEAQKKAARGLLAARVAEMRYWTLEEGVALLEELAGGLG